MKNYTFRLTIPTHWTAEQARSTVKFIDAISNAIWDIYETDIIALKPDDSSLVDSNLRLNSTPSNQDFPF